MSKILSLGNHYVSDFVKEESDYNNRQKYPLDLILDEEIGAVKLTGSAPLDMMYGKYWYRSGINNSMTQQLKSIVDEITARISYKDNDIWLDIACNDGTLLKFVPNNFIKLGIDPADDSYFQESSKVANKVVQDFFSLESYNKTGYGDKKCKVISIIAMFYDLDDPDAFIKDVYEILEDDGLLVLQMSYTPLMLQQMAFDNICHEHIYYYSLNSIQKLFNKHGFRIVDCSLNDTNGGSFRVYLQKNIGDIKSFASSPMRDVCNFRVNSLLEYEKKHWDISDINIWKVFEEKLNNLKTDLVDFISKEKAAGKKIYGYGASTKGNTLLQYFGLDNTLIEAIAERSPYKYGLKTVGTNIPIISEEDMRKQNPDYLLVLPWHFIDEFKKREKDFLQSGGKLIVPCPEFQVIGV